MKELMGKMSDAPSRESDESDAKMAVLNELRGMMIKMMGDKMPGSKPEGAAEISVSAPDEEGLKEGLSMASSLVPSEKPESMPDMDMLGGDEDMELDEIEAQIRELEEMRRAKLMKA